MWNIIMNFFVCFADFSFNWSSSRRRSCAQFIYECDEGTRIFNRKSNESCKHDQFAESGSCSFAPFGELRISMAYHKKEYEKNKRNSNYLHWDKSNNHLNDTNCIANNLQIVWYFWRNFWIVCMYFRERAHEFIRDGCQTKMQLYSIHR